MSAIILNGSIVHYEALGRGRPVLFLHGWVGSWRYWIPAMQVASNSFRTYAVDLFGFGETSRDSTLYPLPRQAELVHGFLDHLGVGKVAIIGHGLGALVGFSYLSQWPGCVDRIMAINCPLEYSAVNGRMQSTSSIELATWLASRSPGASEFLLDANKADQKAIAVSLDNLQSNNLFHNVRELGIPCLFVFGQNDPAISAPENPEEETLPFNLHQIVMEGSGHFPMIDEPARFNRLMTDFLVLEPGLSPRALSLKEEWRRKVR